MPAGRRNRTGGFVNQAPAVRIDFHGLPRRIGKVKVDATLQFGDADMDVHSGAAKRARD